MTQPPTRGIMVGFAILPGDEWKAIPDESRVKLLIAFASRVLGMKLLVSRFIEPPSRGPTKPEPVVGQC
jgi:hypothetical protein